MLRCTFALLLVTLPMVSAAQLNIPQIVTPRPPTSYAPPPSYEPQYRGPTRFQSREEFGTIVTEGTDNGQRFSCRSQNIFGQIVTECR